MGVDWDQVRRNNAGVLGPEERERLTAQEAAWLAGRRQEEQERHQAEQHTRDVEAYARFAAGKSRACLKQGNATDAETWAQAVENIADRGVWTIAPIITSDPEVMRFAGLRTALNYEGKNVQLKG